MIGNLLSQIRIPVPILFISGSKVEYFPELLKETLKVTKYSLILNVGTPKTAKCGKTKLLAKIMSLE
jgi:hypothetical protein